MLAGEGGSRDHHCGTKAGFDHSKPQACSTDADITRSLLGYLALGGPFYVVVSLARAMARSGFSLTRDEWSLLSGSRP